MWGLTFSQADRLIQTLLGVGILSMLDWLLGLWTTDAVGYFSLLLIGWLLLVYDLRGIKQKLRLELPRYSAALMPAAGLMLGACAIAPGFIWASEFGGYDALEYHLQLPMEWVRIGAIRGLEHNAYSYLPNLLESAYVHLAVWLRHKPYEWAYAAQILHAALAILAALAIRRIVLHLTGSAAIGWVVAAVYLSTPWTIVTGSMAYNEQAVMAMGAGAVLLVIQSSSSHKTQASSLLIGLLCGFAVMFKLTAAGMIALPVRLLLLLSPGRPQGVGFFIGAGLVVAPWMVRNAVWTGNPVFPMFADLLGGGHWTVEQAVRWKTAHAPHGSFVQTLGLLFSPARGLLHPQFGYVVFPAAIFGAIRGWTKQPLRTPVFRMLLFFPLQIGFWLLFTHLQSRFLIPLLLPACVLIGLGLNLLPRARVSMAAGALIVAVLVVQPFALYFKERNGQAATLIGMAEVVPSFVKPYDLFNGLRPGSHIYSEGFALPFYVTPAMTYHTCWDRSPMGPALKEGGPPAAAAWLRRQGYSHVLIDWMMLDIWMSPGNYGYDPDITMESLLHLASEHLTLVPGQNPGSPTLLYTLR